MTGGRHGQEFGEPLDHAEEDRLSECRRSWRASQTQDYRRFLAYSAISRNGEEPAQSRECPDQTLNHHTRRGCSRRAAFGNLVMTDFDGIPRPTLPTVSTDAGPAPRRQIPDAPIVQVSMITLFHHPFCPHSRFVRVALGEYGLDTRLVEERVWERREEFLVINPAATTPVLRGGRRAGGAGRGDDRRISRRDLWRAHGRAPADARRASTSASRCAASPPGSTTNSSRKSPARWCWSGSTSAICRGRTAAARRRPMRCARRGPICAIIWPISAGWRRRGTGSPAIA